MAWKPPMPTVIASSQMTRTRLDGVQTTITVEIGTPLPVPPEVGIRGWYCTTRITGVPGISADPDVHFGAASAQALIVALCYPGTVLSALPFGREIDFSVVPNFGFPRLPGHELVRVEARPG